MIDVSIIVDKLDEMSLLRKSRQVGDWYQCYCPFHNDGKEKKPSFGILLHDQYRNGNKYPAGFGHCFTCSFAGSLTTTISKILETKDIRRSGIDWLKENIPGFEIAEDDFDYLIPKEVSADIVNKYAINYINSLTNQKPVYVSEQELASYRLTVPYMYERRLTDDIIAKYDVGFDANFRPEGSKNPVPCITFPIRDINGNTVSFCRRSIKGKKFFMPKGIEKPVYGIYELPKNAKSVVICESCFNCLTAVSYGYNAVALLGTGTESEISQLQRLGANEYVLCLDNDDAGHRGIKKLKKALSPIAIVWTVTIPPIVDPQTGESKNRDVNDLTKEEFDYYYSQRE